MSDIERIRAAAQVSVGRATMFGALAIWAASFGFISWPLTAFRLAALLSTLTMVILIYKAVQAPRRPYRRTEVWVMLGKNHGLPEESAQHVISGVLRDTFWRFASLVAAVAGVLWLAAIALGIFAPGMALGVN